MGRGGEGEEERKFREYIFGLDSRIFGIHSHEVFFSLLFSQATKLSPLTNNIYSAY